MPVSHPLGFFIRNLFKEEGIVPNIAFSFDDEITISEMVAQNMGIAVLANIPILRRNFSTIPLDIKSELPIIYLTYNKNLNHSGNIKRFIRHIMANADYHKVTSS